MADDHGRWPDPRNPLTPGQHAAVQAHLDAYVQDILITPPGPAEGGDLWTTASGSPSTWEDIVTAYRAIQDAEARRLARWEAGWRGRLDGATLTDVMRLRHYGELPHTCHIAMGRWARHRLRQRFATQSAAAGTPGGRWRPVGLTAPRLDDVPVIIDEAIGGHWEVRHGPAAPPAAPSPVLARGWRLA
jgi:hypothetical protein